MLSLRSFFKSQYLTKTFVALFLTLFLAHSAQAKVVFNRGNFVEPESLDPSLIEIVETAHIADDMFLGLLTYDAYGKTIPGIAKSWTISDDGLTYTFKLNDYVWSDGVPITAKDAKFGIMRTLNPKIASAYASILYPIKGAKAYNRGKKGADTVGIKVVDDKTLMITLSHPTSYFLGLMAHHASFPQPEHTIKKYGRSWTKPNHIVVSGAYTLTKWLPNTYIKLERNPKFYDNKKVQIDTVYYYPTQDKGSSWLAFKNAELDYDTGVSTDQIDIIKKTAPGVLKTELILTTYLYTFNTSKKPFDDVRVRQALAMTIDRKDIIQALMVGLPTPAYSFAPPGLPNYDNPPTFVWKDWSWEKRVQEAKKLLKQAGFDKKHPLKFTLSYNTSEGHKRIAVEISAIWKEELGVQTELFNTDTKVHFANMRKGDFDVARYGWGLDYPDVSNILYLCETDAGAMNSAKYSNPEFDKLMDQSKKEPNLQKRAQLLRKAEAIALRDVPYVPIYFYNSTFLVSTKLKGWHANLMGQHLTRYMKLTK